MKQKKEKEKRLRLGKTKIQDFNTALDRDAQKRVKGGTGNGQEPTTQVPIYC
jgi:hypothetical protein